VPGYKPYQEALLDAAQRMLKGEVLVKSTSNAKASWGVGGSRIRKYAKQLRTMPIPTNPLYPPSLQVDQDNITVSIPDPYR